MNYTFTQNLLIDAPAMFATMRREPKISFHLALADLETIVLTMFCAIYTGVSNADALFQYLTDHGANIRRDTFEFLLRAFDGKDMSADLWTSNEDGEYEALVEAMPAYWEGGETLPEPSHWSETRR